MFVGLTASPALISKPLSFARSTIAPQFSSETLGKLLSPGATVGFQLRASGTAHSASVR
ncbi:hypothetical protein H6F86_02145 [Phormidium sp. FACHB-592]|uniref:Uncharacterized protein n=1 Tax=Stenomitos frigidus AS-A4 TaxID=2933935 RepID=A0ABV0KJY3_9CYAN|nr:hypothetical protein [Phormidium sp. FACHB-592]MBD2072707.1 hypothetical protein [Phormidium sp. FACHB-592]